MDTKAIILTLIHRAKSDCDTSLNELFGMMNQAVMRTDEEEIDWHLMNDLTKADILLLIVLTDIYLTINFDELVLNEAVNYVVMFDHNLVH
ncbi:hypothetical protein [Vibrio nomapromontoriensis]|uniref:hypothetical protein n=1 Tax=Vibrio nomapromontoriensis TaxID=2910246 RepID=UPI003D0A9E13